MAGAVNEQTTVERTRESDTDPQGGQIAPKPWPRQPWPRYQYLGVVGRGATGSVFKALDPQLNRLVALKFLHGDDPLVIERVQREAQAQARVDHEHICKVYEIGEVEGRPYIAMQFIDGESLKFAAPRLTLEEKVKLVKEAAEALHEAHRAGLIHRDVKPQNIMVGHTAERGWTPWVTDFGLARQTETPGTTLTGAIAGTPSFMSPEQARGETHRLDRRTDVYGLGATLYATLTDQPPFDGANVTDVLRKVLQDVPRPPRQLNPSIPPAIEWITMRCLRKNPAERYGSARELAEDLGRYLDGEPVHAKRTTLWYRLKMKAAKHKAEVIIAATALVLLAGTGTWGLYTKWRSDQISRLAQSFGQEVEHVEALARHAALTPLHDTRPERNLIQEHMARIEKRMDELGSMAIAPGHYALGRGSLALGTYEVARAHLQTAWDLGYREPEIAYSLGLVLGHLYEQELRETELIPSTELRAVQRRRIEEEYRTPALDYLRRIAGLDVENPVYVEALLDHYEGRHGMALAKARAAYEGRPWFYEAKQLEGEIHVAVAGESVARGDFAASTDSYRDAEAAFYQAIEVGSSDAGVYVALGSLHRMVMFAEINDRGGDVTPSFRKGVQAVESSLIALPGNPAALDLLSSLHGRMAQYQITRGEDPRVHLQAAVAAAESSLAHDPDGTVALNQLGTTYRQLAGYQQNRGGDPTESFERAAAAYAKARSIDSTSVSHARAGLLFKEQAQWLMHLGEDSGPALAASIQAYEDGLVLTPDDVGLLHNRAVSCMMLAQNQDEIGQDPLPTIAKAIASSRAALAVNPDHAVVLYQLGFILNEQARYVFERGGDPMPSVSQAVDAYSRALALNPQSAYATNVHDGLGVAHSQRFDYEREQGIDPREAYDLALDSFERTTAADPNHATAPTNQAGLHLARAEHARDVGDDPEPFLVRALDCGRRALEVNAEATRAHAVVGEVHRLRAAEQLDVGADPMTSIREARAAFEKAASINPSSGDALLGLGRLQAMEARWLVAQGQEPHAAFTAAARWLEEAIRLRPNDVRPCLALAELRSEQADWRLRRGEVPRSEIDGGLAMVDRALSLRAGFARAMALRAVLLRYDAESVEDDTRRREILERARASLSDAVARNAHLASRYQGEREILETALAAS